MKVAQTIFFRTEQPVPRMVVRSLLVLVSAVSALDYDSLELEEGAGRQIFTSGGVAYLALNQTFALLIGRSLYTNQPTMDPAIDILTLTFTYV